MNFIDAHAHVQDSENAVGILEQSFRTGIQWIALGGTHPPDWNKQEALAQLFPGFLFTHFGLHPWWVEQYSRKSIESILHELDQKLPFSQGLGETGLDFYLPKRNPDRFGDQEWAFREQLRLAVKHSKPVVVHAVHAHEKVLSIILEELRGEVPVMLHRYSGSLEQARLYLKLGAYFSFHETKPWMTQIPLTQLLLETDSNPRAHPGGWDIRPHYEKTAKIIGLPLLDLQQKVAENFLRIGYSLGR